jgi:hypothetical protein
MGFGILLAGLVFGDIPKQINYQGVLAGAGGTPLADSTVNVEFRIYDTPAGGSSKWVETQSVTTDGLGRFSVTLGSVNPIEDTVFREVERYLSINIESSGEVTPRAKIASVAYANRVSTIDGTTGGSISGNVGIGTTTPTEKLDVDGSIAIRNNNALRIFSDGIGLVATSAPGAYGTFDFYKTGDLNASVRLGHSNFPVARSFTILTGDGTGGAAERLTILPSGNVGIGTNNPSKNLDVVGSIRTSDTLFASNVSSLGPLRLQTAGTTKIYVDDASGNVGVGTENPNIIGFPSNHTFLTVQSNTDTRAGIISLNGTKDELGPNINVGLVAFVNTSSSDSDPTVALIAADVPSGFDDRANLDFYTNDGTNPPGVRLSINSNGNVGIGTESASHKLEVVGDLKVSGDILGSTPWTPLPFSVGYENIGSPWQSVQYRKIGDVVYLRGSLRTSDFSPIPYLDTLGTLPVGFRPPAAISLGRTPFCNGLDIFPNGDIISEGCTGYFQALDDISFSTSP